MSTATDMHAFRTGETNSTWAGSGDTDTFKCHYCGAAETVRKGAIAQNVRWVSGTRNGVLYACNQCIEIKKREGGAGASAQSRLIETIRSLS
jgi:hypothetical protein